LAIDPALVVGAAAGGLAIGTLADPFVDQLYSDPFLYSPFGRCARCNTKLLPFGAIALVGFVRWRGACPHCGRRFPIRSLLLPFGAAALFAITLLAYEDAWRIALTLAFGMIALVFLATDAERRTLPDRLMYPVLVAAVIVAPFWPQHSAVNAYLTGIGLLALFVVLRRLLGVRIGLGDVKFALLIGLTLAMPDTLIAFAVAGIAAFGAIIVVFAESAMPARLLPYSSMLATGMLFALLWGEPLRDAV
jgi:leader peptidase (prepilin peptidase)/N-methyltransferase